MKNYRKQGRALLLTLVLTLSLLTPALASDFSDVSGDAWYAPAVDYCTEHSFMNGVGDGRFDPEGSVSRAMVVTVLYRMCGAPTVYTDRHFEDVAADSWYAMPVDWAARTNLTSGLDETHFGPDAALTREQLATFLWRAAGSPPAENPEPFADSGEVSAYAADAVAWAREAGVVSGLLDNRFDPKGGATRAQLAQVLTNFAQSGHLLPSVLSEIDVLCAPMGMAMTEDGTLLVADAYYKLIWQVKDGVSAVYAGADTVRDLYDEPLGGYNDAALDMTYFRLPWAIVPFLDGWAVSDADNDAVRLLRPEGTQTVNGQTTEKLAMTDLGVAFAHPTGLATDEAGNLYVSDTHNGAVRKVTPKGDLTTFADGLNDPTGLCWCNGVLYAAETGANRVVKITDGKTEVLAGSGADDWIDGPASQAAFSAPQGVEVADDGAVYIADTANSAVRVLRDGQVSTLLIQDQTVMASFPVSPTGLLVKGDTLYVSDSFARKVFTIFIE